MREQYLIGCKLEEVDKILSYKDVTYSEIRIWDDENQVGDCLYKPYRINIIVKDGIVTEVYYG